MYYRNVSQCMSVRSTHCFRFTKLTVGEMRACNLPRGKQKGVFLIEMTCREFWKEKRYLYINKKKY